MHYNLSFAVGGNHGFHCKRINFLLLHASDFSGAPWLMATWWLRRICESYFINFVPLLWWMLAAGGATRDDVVLDDCVFL